MEYRRQKIHRNRKEKLGFPRSRAACIIYIQKMTKESEPGEKTH